MNGEACASPRAGLDAHATAALVYDAFAGGQTEPGTAAHAFGRKKRLENARQDFGRDAGAGVLDGERDVSTGREPLARPGSHDHVARLGAQASATRHGVARVERKIQDPLLDLARVRINE